MHLGSIQVVKSVLLIFKTINNVFFVVINSKKPKKEQNFFDI